MITPMPIPTPPIIWSLELKTSSMASGQLWTYKIRNGFIIYGWSMLLCTLNSQRSIIYWAEIQKSTGISVFIWWEAYSYVWYTLFISLLKPYSIFWTVTTLSSYLTFFWQSKQCFMTQSSWAARRVPQVRNISSALNLT